MKGRQVLTRLSSPVVLAFLGRKRHGMQGAGRTRAATGACLGAVEVLIFPARMMFNCFMVPRARYLQPKIETIVFNLAPDRVVK
jgi:hypothetical protein